MTKLKLSLLTLAVLAATMLLPACAGPHDYSGDPGYRSSSYRGGGGGGGGGSCH